MVLKASVLHHTRLKGLQGTNEVAFGPTHKFEKQLIVENTVCIHKTSFSSYFKNKLNKSERYITISWKGLRVTNTLAY